MTIDPGLLIVGALIALFVVFGLALVVAASRAGPRTTASSRQALGMSAGMLFGAALGAIVWMSTGEFVFWVIFMGGGMVLGLAIGSARTPQER
jgi:hypothetical protein